MKPPFPGVAGLWQQPTIVNNVETLASVPAIMDKGGAWYKALGTADTTGTKIYQIIGHVKTPQIVEVPAGITLRELIDTYGGGLRPGSKFKMCQTGGASAGIVTAAALDTPIDYGSMSKVGGALGSGTMLVMDESVCAVDFIRSVAAILPPRVLRPVHPLPGRYAAPPGDHDPHLPGPGKHGGPGLHGAAGRRLDRRLLLPPGADRASTHDERFEELPPGIRGAHQEKKCRAGVCKLG